MDVLVQIMQTVWRFFISVSFPITYQGVTYNITLYGLLIFTVIVSIAAVLIAKAFD